MADADVILTDTEFAGGAFADWLSLWPVPAVLVADPDFDPARLAGNTVDESSTFILRDPDRAWSVRSPRWSGRPPRSGKAWTGRTPTSSAPRAAT